MNYTDIKWRNKRTRILKRDGYLCRECKRYGKKVTATTVHHIKPVEDHPKLKYDSKNLYSCCNSCHNTFHDRATDNLTLIGLQLADRIYK